MRVVFLLIVLGCKAPSEFVMPKPAPKTASSLLKLQKGEWWHQSDRPCPEGATLFYYEQISAPEGDKREVYQCRKSAPPIPKETIVIPPQIFTPHEIFYFISAIPTVFASHPGTYGQITVIEDGVTLHMMGYDEILHGKAEIESRVDMEVTYRNGVPHGLAEVISAVTARGLYGWKGKFENGKLLRSDVVRESTNYIECSSGYCKITAREGSNTMVTGTLTDGVPSGVWVTKPADKGWEYDIKLVIDRNSAKETWITPYEKHRAVGVAHYKNGLPHGLVEFAKRDEVSWNKEDFSKSIWEQFSTSQTWREGVLVQ